MLRQVGLAAAVVSLAAAGCSSSPGPTPVPDPGIGPSLTCPADVSTTSPSDGPTAVTYQPPTPVNGTAPVSVGCVPPSGSTFAVGPTLVYCTATDARARVGACSFSVRVSLAPKLRHTRFMAFGDSLTEGVIALRAPLYSLVPSSTSYPGDLQVLLSNRYISQTITVDDEGRGGEAAFEGRERLEDLLRSSTPPEVVLLLEGANDLNEFGEPGLKPAAQAMEEMVAAVQDAGAVAFLATLPPQRPGGLRVYHHELVAPYNDRLAEVASHTGATLVDLYAAFGGTASTELVGSDGLHLTETGYQKVADTFFAAIKAKLETPPPAFRSR